jgi:superfamily II RNA helicase
MAFLKVINPNQDCELPSDMAIEYKFPLDPFQKHALNAIAKDEIVFVTAKTGSGKTLVGEYQIAHSLRKGKRVFYTTPIKSLSNQKFHDLKEMFGDVGIMTGDIKFCPDAKVLIMTTEILRNMLFKQQNLDDLDSVIFDEVHYINNTERGKIWEETMILLPKHVNMILLSATIDSPELFGSWLGNLKEKMVHLIGTTYRIVPLKHVVVNQDNTYSVVMNEKDIFDERKYRIWTQAEKQIHKDHKTHKQTVANRDTGQVIGKDQGKVVVYSYTHKMNELIRLLEEREQLPALFFVFSRDKCEKFAKSVEGSLINSSESAEVHHIIRRYLHAYKELEKVPQYHKVIELLQRGIAYHHSGVLPLLKEMIEILFSKGLVRLLFATETFAVGINMPTKTVVFTALQKFDTIKRCLYTDEYIQMAGRAGRRGKDKEGLVIYFPEHEPVYPDELEKMMTGKKASIQSKMDFHYDFILKSMSSSLTGIVEQSYWYQQLKLKKIQVENDIVNLKKKIEAFGFTDKVIAEITIKKQLQDRIKQTCNAERKKAQQDYDRWNNSHVGPLWNRVEKQQFEYNVLTTDLKISELQLAEFDLYDQIRQVNVHFLEHMGFIEDGKLTKAGLLAVEVNEANPILLINEYLSGTFENMTCSDIVAFLSMFLKEKTELEGSALPAHIASYQKECIEKSGTDDYWSLQTGYQTIMDRYANGEDAAALCTEYGIYEGTFYRMVMSISNMVEELTKVMTICEDLEGIKNLENVQRMLIRGIIVPDSLYLRF